MLENVVYKNHLNEAFEFGKNGVFVNESDLHDYTWNITKKNNRISALDYAITTKKLQVTIICSTEEEGVDKRNRLFEVTEKDVLAFQPGKLYVGSYYLNCYVTKSEKQKYLVNRRYMLVKLTLSTDCPYWVKETSTVFSASSGGADAGGFDYSHDHPFDYGNDTTAKTINNPGFVASNFRLAIMGACTNPAINIAGHVYQVNTFVASGQYLLIDSANKTVTLQSSDGTKTNVFNSRNRDSYIFEKIPAGASLVSWSGDFSFEVVLLEERSEPKWT